MTDLDQSLKRRTVWLVCHDGLADDRVVAGRGDLPIRPSPRTRYERVRRALPSGEEVEHYTAPVRRCVQTASRLRGEAKWEPFESLLPRAMGAWEGRSWDELRTADAERVEAWWSDFSRQRAPGGGEGMGEVMSRADAFLTGMANRSAWTDAVVVASPESIGALVCTVLGVDAMASRSIEFEPLSVTRLRRSWLSWRLISLNSAL